MKKFSLPLLGLIVITGSIFLFLNKPVATENKTRILKINDTSIEVEVADSPEAQKLGLSGRAHLADGTGMLFIFETPGQYGFWMKDMNFAIDIVWIDENFRIIGLEKSVSPETFPQSFHPNQPIKYVLELPSGFSDVHRIGIGTVVQ